MDINNGYLGKFWDFMELIISFITFNDLKVEYVSRSIPESIKICSGLAFPSALAIVETLMIRANIVFFNNFPRKINKHLFFEK
jgi:hypothetical protein